MTPEERYERIEEKHQALAETVELIGSNMVVMEKALTKLSVHMDRIATLVLDHNDRINRLEEHPE